MNKLLPLLLLLFLFSCKNKNFEAERAKLDSITMADSIAANEFSAAKQTGADSGRTFVRTADMKFRVKDVRKATTEIENITARNRGFVTYTNLSTSIENQTLIPINSDSSTQLTSYSNHNDIIIRVPNELLDTTLRQLAKLVVFLDYRTIKADDVSLLLLSNKLAQKRAKRFEQRVNNIKSDKDAMQCASTGEYLQEKSDNAMIDNLSLMDQFNYSTININIYQNPVIHKEVIENINDFKEYEPGFFSKLWDSVATGWTILKEIILFFVRIWSVLLVIGGIVWAIVYYSKKPRGKE